MTEKPKLADQLIIYCLNAHYGIEVATLTFLPMGADMNASIYKVQAQDRSPYFVKLKRGHHPDISVEIVERLHEAGIHLVIPPIKTLQGRLTQHVQRVCLP